jgi:neutral ceramidase
MRWLLSLSFALLLALSLSAGEKSAPWQAGAAKVNITPKQFMWMSGYASRNKPAEGKLNDLYAKALILQDPAGNTSVLVTLDLVGIQRTLSVNVCEKLSKQFGFPRENIIISTSHTHSGPVVRDNLQSMFKLDEQQVKLINDYAIDLENNILAAVAAAKKNLEPAKLSWDIGKATFAVNRRTNKEADVPKLRDEGKLLGPVDHSVPVLAVRDTKGKLKAVAFGYACHATVLSGYEWSSDYPGFAQSELESAHPGAVALFWAGCGGDQNPLPRRSVALAKKYGAELATAVNDILNQPMKSIKGRFRAACDEIDLPFSELPTREVLVKDTLDKNKYVAIRAKMLLEELEKKGSLRGTYPYPVQTWQLGPDVTWVTLGGEVVVDYGLRLKKELGPTTWVMGYANDVMAYIPSLRVLKEGGYEGGGAMVYYGLPTVWSPQVEERIIAAVHRQVKKDRK